MNINKAIGFRVKQAREFRNLTQDELAERLDVSTSFVSRLETGSCMPSISRLYRISVVLNISFQDLVCDLFARDDSSLDTVDLEIMQNLRMLSYSDKQHVLKYIELFNHYLKDNSD